MGACQRWDKDDRFQTEDLQNHLRQTRRSSLSPAPADVLGEQRFDTLPHPCRRAFIRTIDQTKPRARERQPIPHRRKIIRKRFCRLRFANEAPGLAMRDKFGNLAMPAAIGSIVEDSAQLGVLPRFFVHHPIELDAEILIE
jgi:hypothetical protein